MGEILITFIKQSSAYQLQKYANRMGIGAKIVQTPKELSQGGCTYGVVARRKDAESLVSICKNAYIDYRRVFSVYTDTSGKKFYNEI